MIAPKLKAGDEIRVIAPAQSINLPFITEQIRQSAVQRLESLGLKVSFGKHVSEVDEFDSTSVEHRVEDLNDAFFDTNVRAVLTVIGGFNSNELLKYINYEIIKENPKVLCGYSDITALQNAIYAKTGLVTYSGPAYFTFGAGKGLEYSGSYFRKCLFEGKAFEVKPSTDVTEWSSKNATYLNYKNDGPWILRKGKARGKIIGANLCTFNLLQGTEFMPKIRNSILFIEDDEESDMVHFARDLQSLFHLSGSETIRGVVIGRFQKGSGIDRERLTKILNTIVKGDIPILANMDFGHTHPMITFPIGGTASVVVDERALLRILNH
ncbi:MAG: LD-carboxypeptidase [Candidatus Micrarchaeota archaeon]|nr:LD-carboxypeptidase [Candidatus Micrarchaeota archaeon]